ncbi:hypothetical protein B5M47_02540 [candidate division CPR3 bacterium 4484_211]|uniref:Uncharacterized protein n=1 Tax=candidate division CPR3 bacterium 4484_211 TaxID=1968527 RepID=A0A1W9NY15_UNCC3|nr:MAG: hypothetical protein B5M47_02540 [candidate division CPR3 bacterium 4484_211]
MDKYLFVEFKHGKVDPEAVINSGANKLMIAAYTKDPDPNLVEKARSAGLTIGLCSGAYREECAANPKSRQQIIRKIKHLVSLNPDEIWIDRLRFHGRWETKGEKVIYQVHEACRFCKNLNRADLITDYFFLVRNLIPASIKLGFFAVPFMAEVHPEYRKKLGFDYRRILKSVDMISPMLYHRMIGQPVSCISEYVQYLDGLGYRYIIPIIQVKDMPDNLPDGYSVDELKRAYQEAIKPPSSGVAFFTWDHAQERGKDEIVVALLRS